MDELTLGAIALPATLIALASALAALWHFEVGPWLAWRRTITRLRSDVQRAVDEYRPPPRRHDAHCPACGRFAVLVFDGERGRVTRCRAHGVLSRAHRLVARERPHPYTVTTHRPHPALALVRVVEPSFVCAEPARPWDWLDGPEQRGTLPRWLAAA